MRYTYVRQHDTTDCAAACLAMVCLHYKKEVTITRLRDMMGTDLKGTNLVGLQKAANELGFTTAAVRVDRENFLSDFSLPCIAQVITDQGLAHFVVVFKKTTIKDEGVRRKHMLQDAETRKEEEKKGKKHKCKDYVIIGDPGTELKKISLDEFYKNFTGVLLLLNPTSEFKGGKLGSRDGKDGKDGKSGKYGMMKRYIDLLLPQKKLFFYAILSSVITTILGIASSMFNKILMDEVLPYVLESGGSPIVAAFCSMSAGKTESAENVWGASVPYLVSVDSSADTTAPRYLETADFTAQELQTQLAGLLPDADWDTAPADWFRIVNTTDAGTVLTLTVCGQTCTGQEVRDALALRSAAFTVAYADGKFTFTTRGFGHGVGMSQYGANAMAKDGADWREILMHYYPKTEIVSFSE